MVSLCRRRHRPGGTTFFFFTPFTVKFVTRKYSKVRSGGGC